MARRRSVADCRSATVLVCIVRSNTAWRALPSAFARYMAVSASRSMPYRLPARGEVQLVGPQVPVPEAIVGTAGGQRVALFALAQRFRRLPALGDVDEQPP